MSLSTPTPIADLLSYCNGLGRYRPGGTWFALRQSDDGKFFGPSGEPAVTPHEFRRASLDEIVSEYQ